MTDLPGGIAPADGGSVEEAGPAGPDGPAQPLVRGRATPGIDLPGPRSIRAAWRRGGTAGRIGLVLASAAALVLLGAFLFGFWHVLWGGFVRGNWRAGGFGIALASACGVLLWIDAIVLRRLGARA